MEIHRCTVLFLLIVLISGCSGGKSLIAPDPLTGDNIATRISSTNRFVWGYWDVLVDPEDGSAQVVPRRDVASHFNVVKLLEVSPCSACLIVSNLTWLSNNVLKCNLQINHPFPGLVKFTGFDVRGIFISDGDTWFPESDRLVSLDGSNPMLLEPDGYTSLFNPFEFDPANAPFPILGYIKGKYSYGEYLTATLNPYIAYGKSNPRRIFAAGSGEIKSVKIKYKSVPFEFGYAVDASWAFAGDVTDPETDFPPDANSIEPYRIEMELSGVLDEMAGDTTGIYVDIYDYQGIDTIGKVTVESPQLFIGEIPLSYASQSGDDSWKFSGIITNQFGAPDGHYPLLVKAESLDIDPNLGELPAYDIQDITVGSTVIDDSLYWAVRAGGVDADGARDIAVLSDDSIVSTGFFHGTANFGEGDENETWLQSAGSDDVYIALHDPDGKLRWALRGGGVASDYGLGVESFDNDDIIVTGYFQETATFIDNSGKAVQLTSNGDLDVFLVKYDVIGNILWANSFGSTTNDRGRSLLTFSDGSFIIGGNFTGTVTWGNGEPNETTYTSYGNWDVYLIKYNSDGTVRWAKRAGGPYAVHWPTSTKLPDDSIVISGRFKDTVTFGEGEQKETVLESYGGYDIFLAKFNPDGSLVWAQHAGGPGNDYGREIAALSDDSVAFTGYFSGTAVFGKEQPGEALIESAGNLDVFVARYVSDGSFLWVKRAGGIEEDMGRGISVLSDDSIIVAGGFRHVSVFGEGDPGELTIASYGDEDVFFARYDPDGAFINLRRAGAGSSDGGLDIYKLSDDSIVMTGIFSGESVFGLYEGNETTLVSDGGTDIFVMRIAP